MGTNRGHDRVLFLFALKLTPEAPPENEVVRITLERLIAERQFFVAERMRQRKRHFVAVFHRCPET